MRDEFADCLLRIVSTLIGTQKLGFQQANPPVRVVEFAAKAEILFAERAMCFDERRDDALEAREAIGFLGCFRNGDAPPS